MRHAVKLLGLLVALGWVFSVWAQQGPMCRPVPINFAEAPGFELNFSAGAISISVSIKPQKDLSFRQICTCNGDCPVNSTLVSSLAVRGAVNSEDLKFGQGSTSDVINAIKNLFPRTFTTNTLSPDRTDPPSPLGAATNNWTSQYSFSSQDGLNIGPIKVDVGISLPKNFTFSAKSSKFNITGAICQCQLPNQLDMCSANVNKVPQFVSSPGTLIINENQPSVGFSVTVTDANLNPSSFLVSRVASSLVTVNSSTSGNTTTFRVTVPADQVFDKLDFIRIDVEDQCGQSNFIDVPIISNHLPQPELIETFSVPVFFPEPSIELTFLPQVNDPDSGDSITLTASLDVSADPAQMATSTSFSGIASFSAFNFLVDPDLYRAGLTTVTLRLTAKDQGTVVTKSFVIPLKSFNVPPKVTLGGGRSVINPDQSTTFTLRVDDPDNATVTCALSHDPSSTVTGPNGERQSLTVTVGQQSASGDAALAVRVAGGIHATVSDPDVSFDLRTEKLYSQDNSGVLFGSDLETVSFRRVA